MEMTTTEVQQWVGRSDEVAVPMLGGEFWTNGKEVSGVFESAREQKIGGFAYKLTLDAAGPGAGGRFEMGGAPRLTGLKKSSRSLPGRWDFFMAGLAGRGGCVGGQKR